MVLFVWLFHLFDEGVEAGGGEVGGVLVEVEPQRAAGSVFAAAVGRAAFEDVSFLAKRAGDLLKAGDARFALGRFFVCGVSFVFSSFGGRLVVSEYDACA